MAYDKKVFTEKSEIIRQHEMISSKNFAEVISEYSQDFVGIINETRQFVLLNAGFFEEGKVVSERLGARPGDLFGCVHVKESPFGCGNSEACGYCDAVITVVEALTTFRRVTRDGRLMVNTDGKFGALDIRITAIPTKIEGSTFVLLFIKDISREKRIELLERAFFHDVLNTSNSLHSLIALSKVSSDLIPDVEKSIGISITDIVEQIQYFRKLKMAEEGDLVVDESSVDPVEEIKSLVYGFEQMDIGKNKELAVSAAENIGRITTDRVLFRRIMLNMIKNALEASRPGEKVTIAISRDDSHTEFSVNNPAVLPASIKSQIFQRSFSTKGLGRGIGTYSMKMLGERYLGGRIEFSSNEGEGTTFRFLLPHPVQGRTEP